MTDRTILTFAVTGPAAELLSMRQAGSMIGQAVPLTWDGHDVQGVIEGVELVADGFRVTMSVDRDLVPPGSYSPVASHGTE